MMAVLSMLCLVLLSACGETATSTSGGAVTTSAAGAATTSAAVATTSAGVATTSAGVATTSAGVTTTGVATTSAGVATTAAVGGGAGVPAVAVCPDTAKGQTVTMMSPLTGPDGDTMTALVNRFNTENTQGIKVSHRPDPDYITKLGTMSASNTLPDMTVIRGEDITTQAARNILRPIPASAMTLLNLTQADFPAAVWAQGQYKNQRYTIPLDVHPIIMYYNKTMFQAAGIASPPKTGDELDKDALALNQNGVYGWSVTTGVFPTQFLFQTLLHQYGGSEFNADGSQATFNSEAGVKALTYLRQAQAKYAKNNLPQDAGVTAFKQNKSAIEMNGIWQTSSLVTGFPAGAAAPIPQWGDKNAVWASTHELAYTNQKNPDPKKEAAAACWISWLSANSADWSKAGNIPARNVVRTGAAFQANAALAPVASEADVAFFLPSVPGISDGLGPMADAVNAVTAGSQSDVKKALDDAAAKANQALQQDKQKYGGS